MTWQSILLIVLTALLILVWLPWLIISTRKTLRENPRRSRRHPGLAPGSPSFCHPEPVEGSPTENNNKK